MAVTRLYKNGAVVGFSCGLGHNHGSQTEAEQCDPQKYAVKQSAEQKEFEQNRRRQVAENPSYKLALLAAEQLGASEEDAKEVVLKNGCERVLAARDAVAGLGISKHYESAPAPKKPSQPNPPATT